MAENIAEALGMPPRKRAATQISPDKGVKRKRNREGQPQDNPGNSSSNEEDAGLSEENDRSRRNEDERLKEDLKDISQKKIISWHEYFMGVAFLSAKRSKDPKRQVGACIISDERRIVATGYNGMVELDSGNDVKCPWDKDKKSDYVCHAEMNAVVNRHNTSLKGCTIYVTLFPCNECAKLLIQSGIKKVIYYADKAAKEKFKVSRNLFKLKDVELREYKDLDGKYQGRRINLKFDDFAK